MSSVVMYAIARCSLVGGCFSSSRRADSCHRSRSSAYASSAASPSAGRHAATSAAHSRSAVCASAIPEDESGASPSRCTSANRGVMFSTSFCRPSPAHAVEGGVVGPRSADFPPCQSSFSALQSWRAALPVLVLRPVGPQSLRPASTVCPPCRSWFSALDSAARRLVDCVDVCEVAPAPLTPPTGDVEDSAVLEDAVAVVDAIDGQAGTSGDVAAGDLCA